MHFIYGLVDPRTSAVAYVGITDNVYARFKQHLNCTDSNVRKNEWMRQLFSIGLIPIWKLIETVDTLAQARDREKYWIIYYLEKGIDLYNREHVRRSTSIAKDKINSDKVISGKVISQVDKKDLVDMTQTMEILNVSRAYVYQLVGSGALIPLKEQTIKIRHRLYFLRSDVEQLLEKAMQQKRVSNLLTLS